MSGAQLIALASLPSKIPTRSTANTIGNFRWISSAIGVFVGPFLAVIIVVAILIIYFQDSSKERKSVQDAKNDLPPLATITLQKREIGRSRKGLVTYDQHYVLATCRTTNNEERSQSFNYNHHDLNDMDAALQKARVWVHSTANNLGPR